MMIKDRFTRGWIAGALGGLAGGLLGYVPHLLHVSKLRLTDWSSVLIFGRKPPFSLADQLYGLFVLVWSTGCAGVLFAYLLPRITDRNIYFKGWIIFLVPWWFIYLLTALAETEGTLNLSVMTTLSDGISTSVIGLTSVLFYRLFGKKSS